MASKFKTNKMTGHDKAKFKKSFNKANLEMIKNEQKIIKRNNTMNVTPKLKSNKASTKLIQSLAFSASPKKRAKRMYKIMKLNL